MNKTNHGGRRSNQTGRPPIPELNYRVPINFRLPLWLVLWLRQQDGSQGRLVEEALVSYYGLSKGNAITPAGAGAVAESKGD